MNDKKIDELIEKIVENEVNAALKNSGIVDRILNELSENILPTIEQKVVNEITVKDIDMDYFHFCGGILESGNQCRYADYCERYASNLDNLNAMNTILAATKLVEPEECISEGFKYFYGDPNNIIFKECEDV